MKTAWRVRWMMELQRLLIIYMPDVRFTDSCCFGVDSNKNPTQIFPSFTEFFSLLESQKNLRRTYLEMQSDLQHILEEHAPEGIFLAPDSEQACDDT